MIDVIYVILPLIIGFVLDLFLGEVPNKFHPVCYLGKAISFSEKVLRKIFKNLTFAGFILALVLPVFIFVIFLAIQKFLYTNMYLYILTQSVFFYFAISAKSLKLHSTAVYNALKNGDLIAARELLGKIVGRDTQALGEENICRACIETVAENTADGVVCPMFYMGLYGAALAWYYKSVNTLDSMVGYKNEKYILFGKCSAKLDDILNFIPARFSALCMLGACFILKYNYKDALRIYLRDKKKHTSPNSAQCESVCAGALGIQLGGNNHYFGKLCAKPTIGDNLREICLNDIAKANKLMYVSSAVALIIICVLKILVLKFIIQI